MPGDSAILIGTVHQDVLVRHMSIKPWRLALLSEMPERGQALITLFQAPRPQMSRLGNVLWGPGRGVVGKKPGVSD